MNYAAVYTQMHDEMPKKFSGYSIKDHVPKIVELVEQVRPTRILDYGSGRGYQYLILRVHEEWGGILPHCYDVGVRQLSAKPAGLFEGVICTDVLEHIDEPDVDAVLDDIFASVAPGRAFAFLMICCRPANKRLPDGRNAHLSIRPPEWWKAKLARFRREGLIIRDEYEA